MALSLTKSVRFDEDLSAPPSRALIGRTLTLLVEVSRGNLHGQRLESLASTGDLSDCRKIYFDTDNNQKPRYRLVYRLTPNEVRGVAVEAVAVGERRNLDAYLRAARISVDSRERRHEHARPRKLPSYSPHAPLRSRVCLPG